MKQPEPHIQSEQGGDTKGAVLERLIMFTRYPKSGSTKTRLIPVLGAEGAAELQRRMTEHILARAKEWQRLQPISVEVRYQGGSETLMRECFGQNFCYRAQGSGDLGQRMQRAFAEAFQTGAQRVLIIGSDCPEMSADILRRAFDMLQHKPLVLGPATDGGYYMIGLSHPAPELLSNIEWGTSQVLEDTLRVAESSCLDADLTPTLTDVDRPEDLKVWHQVSSETDSVHEIPSISVIIPALNEAANIADAIVSTQQADNVEVFVVDGGSHDRTRSIAAAGGAAVLGSAPCRAMQMNLGAAVARGRILLFLHADTRLPSGFDQLVIKALAAEGAVAGAFRFNADDSSLGMKLIERLINFRSRYFKTPYGDQTIFLRTALFHAIGGFTDMPIMEDVDLIRRLKRHGNITILPEPVVTSARRWREKGGLSTTVLNQVIIAAYLLGVSPTRLAKWYGRTRTTQNTQP